MSEAINPKTRVEEKREIPPALQKILEWDVKATKKSLSFLMNFKPIEQFRKQCKFLEWSCHGLVWLAAWMGFCYMIDSKDLYQTQINMFIGLILDIIVVWILKAVTRRRRPTPDDNPFCFGADKYSFPSGHASRAVFVAFFFIILDPVPFIFFPPLLAWTVSVCFSRFILHRHHILDVVGGMVVGVVEGLIIGILWCNQETSAWLINIMTDDKLSGADV